MAPRNLPAIKRIRQTRYIASDGRAFDSHVEAFKHETFIALKDLIYASTSMDSNECEGLATILLSAEQFRIVLLGPKTPQKELT